MFGRAAIRLGIGPHSSYHHSFLFTVSSSGLGVRVVNVIFVIVFIGSLFSKRYGDHAGNAVEENSSVFYII